MMRTYFAKVFILFAVSLSFLAAPAPLLAHPMGSSSTNEFSAVRLEPGEIRVLYILDLAEIPSYPELKRIDENEDKNYSQDELQRYAGKVGGMLADALELTLDGKPLRLTLEKTTAQALPGLPGLMTVRTELELSAPLPRRRFGRRLLHYRGGIYPERVGWKEIGVFESESYRVISTSPLSSLKSKRLTEYPKKFRRTLPTDTEVDVVFAFGKGEKFYVEAGKEITADRFSKESSRFAKVLEVQDLSLGFILAALGMAFFLGCTHALSPGHGKTLVAAYLIGTRGRVIDAILLGMIVTFTHTVSVILLGVGVLLASRYIVPEKIYPYLEACSGGLVAAIGGWMLLRARRGIHPDQFRVHPHGHSHSHEHHGHHHDHDHHQEHEHAEDKQQKVRKLDIIALGVTGGIVPCPTALVVLLSAVALHRISFGLSLIVIFSFGLAAVLIAIGILMVKAKSLMERFTDSSKAIRILPFVSGGAVTAIGLAILLRALRNAGFF
ncbi:MAG: high-affinity nickel-transporter [bacterium]